MQLIPVVVYYMPACTAQRQRNEHTAICITFIKCKIQQIDHNMRIANRAAFAAPHTRIPTSRQAKLAKQQHYKSGTGFACVRLLGWTLALVRSVRSVRSIARLRSPATLLARAVFDRIYYNIGRICVRWLEKNPFERQRA